MIADNLLTHPEDIWRFLLISIGFFNIGFAGFVATMYLKGHFHSGIYNYGRHVFAIMLSYVTLTAAMMYEIGIHENQPITWRLPVGTIAFLLGTWAIYSITVVRAKLPKQ